MLFLFGCRDCHLKLIIIDLLDKGQGHTCVISMSTTVMTSHDNHLVCFVYTIAKYSIPREPSAICSFILCHWVLDVLILSLEFYCLILMEMTAKIRCWFYQQDFMLCVPIYYCIALSLYDWSVCWLVILHTWKQIFWLKDWIFFLFCMNFIRKKGNSD